MKRAPLIFAIFGIISRALLPAQDAASQPGKSPQAAQPQPMSEEVQKILLEVQKMRLENRYTDALAKLDEAEKLAPNEQLIFTMRGDVYMAPRRRDVGLAIEQHKKAMSLAPENPGPHFNLAEIELSQYRFKEASAAFRKLLETFPKLPMPVRHLAWNRVVICEARLGNFAEAEKVIKAQFTFMDDTPAYQFSNAAIAFAKKDEKMAHEWIARATSIFKQQYTSPYFDALKEMRWIKDVDFEALPVPGEQNKP